MTQNTPPQTPPSLSPSRYVLLGAAILTLLAAMWAGLIRIGWILPPLQPTLPIAHGPLMVSGFLGTVIGIERAVAMKHRWPYSSPALTALGAVLLIAGVNGLPGPLLITLGSVVLLVVFAEILRQHFALYTGTMALGAAAWLVGNILWLFGQPFSTSALWWAAFLILTIVGERLELSRIRQLTRRAYILFASATGLFALGLVVLLFDYAPGTRLAGAGMIALALWLLRYDIAGRTIRLTGLPRFIAACLLSGYVWLGVSGVLAMAYGGVRGGFTYDAMLHSLFLGFVMSMIFGHAPIIFPAVLNRPITYRPHFYVPLVLLHLSLILRVYGDMALWLPGRKWGGMLNVIVLLGFLASTAYSLRGGTSPQAEHTDSSSPAKH